MKNLTTVLIALIFTAISFSQTTVLIDENFDGTTLPTNWNTYADSVGNGLQVWTFGSNILPGGGSGNDFVTNAAIFDDDVAGNTGNHDISWLYVGYSSAIDISAYGQVTLTYDYALNVVSGAGEALTVGLWSASSNTFLPMKIYDTDTNPTTDSIDITSFINAHPGTFDLTDIYFGFGFDDNTSWSYGAGIDNVRLTGSIQPANDYIFRHTATAVNIIANRTIIDNPDLNGNPDAKIVITHNWNQGGGTGVYNDNPTGVWYDSTISRWTIYNEDNAVSMVEGSHYNVYVRGNDSNVITHTVTTVNVNGTGDNTIIDNPILNNNPNAILTGGTYYNPNDVYNTNHLGFLYDDTKNKWTINAEDSSPLPIGAAINVVVASSNTNVESYVHIAIASNTSNNYTTIDHPLLNGKPNAVFIVSHNFNGNYAGSNVVPFNVVDKNLGVYYANGYWHIYNEDLSPFIENSGYNLMIQTTEVASTDTNILANVSIYPNPAEDTLTVESQEALTKVAIFNLLGQEVKSLNTTATNVNIDVANLDAGVYIIKLTANNKESSQKFIKK